jgi:hypothetical protein
MSKDKSVLEPSLDSESRSTLELKITVNRKRTFPLAFPGVFSHPARSCSRLLSLQVLVRHVRVSFLPRHWSRLRTLDVWEPYILDS